MEYMMKDLNVNLMANVAMMLLDEDDPDMRDVALRMCSNLPHDVIPVFEEWAKTARYPDDAAMALDILRLEFAASYDDE